MNLDGLSHEINAVPLKSSSSWRLKWSSELRNFRINLAGKFQINLEHVFVQADEEMWLMQDRQLTLIKLYSLIVQLLPLQNQPPQGRVELI